MVYNKKRTFKNEKTIEEAASFQKKDYPKDIKLLDNFDWAALGVAAIGVIVFIHIVIQYIRGV